MNRIECLNELLEFKVSLSTLSKNLSEFDWDYEEEPTLIKENTPYPESGCLIAVLS